nr:mucin-2-like [Pocillopora verrucosa]
MTLEGILAYRQSYEEMSSVHWAPNWAVIELVCVITSFYVEGIEYNKLGCYRDNWQEVRPLAELLFTDRNETSPRYSGKKYIRKNFSRLYLDDLIQRCASQSKKLGYQVFGIENFASKSSSCSTPKKTPEPTRPTRNTSQPRTPSKKGTSQGTNRRSKSGLPSRPTKLPSIRRTSATVKSATYKKIEKNNSTPKRVLKTQATHRPKISGITVPTTGTSTYWPSSSTTKLTNPTTKKLTSRRLPNSKGTISVTKATKATTGTRARNTPSNSLPSSQTSPTISRKTTGSLLRNTGCHEQPLIPLVCTPQCQMSCTAVCPRACCVMKPMHHPAPLYAPQPVLMNQCPPPCPSACAPRCSFKCSHYKTAYFSKES